jgi:hypothetical protein
VKAGGVIWCCPHAFPICSVEQTASSSEDGSRKKESRFFCLAGDLIHVNIPNTDQKGTIAIDGDSISITGIDTLNHNLGYRGYSCVVSSWESQNEVGCITGVVTIAAGGILIAVMILTMCTSKKKRKRAHHKLGPYAL